MSIWNKVLIGFVFVASAAFFYLAVRTVKTYEYWNNLADGHEFFVGVREQFSETCQDGGTLVVMREGGEDSELRSIRTTGLFNETRAKSGLEESETTPGIRELRKQYNHLTDSARRGRVWFNCSPSENNGRFEVQIPTDPHGIALKTLLYVFEEDNLGQGEYLGELRVVQLGAGAEPRGVTIGPAMQMTAAESDRLSDSAAAGGPWVLYERMPTDSYEVFADWDEEKKEQYLPEESALEYIAHGQKITKEDAETRGLSGRVVVTDEKGNVLYAYMDATGKMVNVTQEERDDEVVWVDEDSGDVVDADKIVDREPEDGQPGTYLRPLRDYRLLFRDYYHKRTLLADEIETNTRKLAINRKTRQEAEELRDAYTRDEATAKQELAEVEKERDALAVHSEALQARVAQVTQNIDRLLNANQATAVRIATIQKDAAGRIDARTRGMAQSGTEGGD
ncbi:MAG TPA: hypothetical protein VMY42_07425 [Thermoguttaceae bacterium]|nr:hypothetical protein [Thermoguttaceae bacterium]